MLFLFGLLIAVVGAAPLMTNRQSITTLTSSQISPFKPYSYFASAAYCNSVNTSTWACGANCDANPGFEPVASGGDGDSIQFWFVGYNPASDEVIVSHQGTNPLEMYDWDVDLTLGLLSSMLFPGIPSSLEAHTGFLNEHAKTATSVLAAVKMALIKFSTTKVVLVGHSLGAAITLLDSIYLPLFLPSSTTFKTICYGLPRVGNLDFADYVDANTNLTHINNKKDFVPIIPGKFLGFVHPTGEIHIQDSGARDSCPGQDNPSKLCSVGNVPTIFNGEESDHAGPYDGVEMGC